jgi:hypothetical protein
MTKKEIMNGINQEIPLGGIGILFEILLTLLDNTVFMSVALE